MHSTEKLEDSGWKMETTRVRRVSRSSISHLLSSTQRSCAAFSMIEMLVAIAVLAVLVVLFARVMSSAAAITTFGHKRMDADSQARQLLDRMQLDFDQMLKRTDVSYWVKTASNTELGNDQIAFFSVIPGYYSQTGYNSNISLVAYRINGVSTSASYNRLERMGKQLPLNGAYSTTLPILFLDGTTYATATATIGQNYLNAGLWPAATSATATDSTYELIGPQVFRFEYYYLLPSGTLSAGPWTGTTSYDMIQVSNPPTGTPAFKDISAIVVDIAVLDPKSKVLLTNAQVATLAGRLVDFTSGSVPGQLLSTWQTALDNTKTTDPDMPRPAIQGVRLYERFYYLSH